MVHLPSKDKTKNPMTPSPLLDIQNLHGGYGRQNVIQGVSFKIEKGDFVGMIGPNGSGKSTLLRLASRVLNPRRGRVLLEGTDIRVLHTKKLFQKMAFVPQDTQFSFPLTVLETVLLGRIPHLGRFQAERKKDLMAAERAVELTDIHQLIDRDFDELSAGERQRIIIAKALAQEPTLLFLDEPTSHLDIGYQVQMLNLLRDLNKNEGLSILVVLHDLNLASEYCDRIILLNNGLISKEGTPQEVLTYQNIESVYKTVVLVYENPVSKRPTVILVSKDPKKP
jgi:iron complex transport system ATP-binding protein